MATLPTTPALRSATIRAIEQEIAHLQAELERLYREETGAGPMDPALSDPAYVAWLTRRRERVVE
jgi:hypothetical protein